MNDRLMPKVVLLGLFVALVVTLSRATGVWGGGGHPAMSPTRGTQVAAATYIPWENSFEEAMQRSAANGKPVLVYFYTDWCPACKRMEQGFQSPEVIGIAGNLTAVKVNAEARTDLASKYGVEAYPTTVVVNSDGSLYTSARGSFEAADFARWLRETFPAAVPTV